MYASAQRNGERVTATEIDKVTSDLETTLGGYYSILAQELQLPLVRRWFALMVRAKELPTLPEGSVEPMIITGISALGRGQDLQRLRGFLNDIQALATVKPQLMQKLNDDEIIGRIANGNSVDTSGLVKSDEQLAAEQQQQQKAAMLQEVVSKGAGPAVGAIAQRATQQQPQGK
jgi:hypothetical protein